MLPYLPVFFHCQASAQALGSLKTGDVLAHEAESHGGRQAPAHPVEDSE
jgi:hypothetical protein